MDLTPRSSRTPSQHWILPSCTVPFLKQTYLIEDSVKVLARPALSLDQDASLQGDAYYSINGIIPRLPVPVDGTLGTPDGRGVINRIITKKYDDLLTGLTAKPAFSAFVHDALTHWGKSQCAKT